MKKLLIGIISFFLFTGLTSPAFAQNYGNGGSRPTGAPQSSVISINKTVQKPGTSTFVENLDSNDPKFQPGATVPFSITVTNTGTTTLTNIQVTDSFPTYMVNSADQKSTAVFSIPTLEVGKSQTFTFNGTIASASAVPQNQRIFCLVNVATATSGNQTSSDNAQLCVENPTITPLVTNKGGNGTTGDTTKGGLPVYTPSTTTQTPQTGPELLGLAALVPGGIIGHWLRRKTK